jgi:hypothetical protein
MPKHISATYDGSEHRHIGAHIASKPKVCSSLFHSLGEQPDIDIARAVQDAHDLHALRDNPIQDQVRELGQGAGIGRYIRPEWPRCGKPPQYFYSGFKSIVELVGCCRIDLADLKPDVDQILARAVGVVNRTHALKLRFARRLFALGGMT